MLHAHLADLPSHLALLLFALEHYLWQFVSETNAFLAQLAPALKLQQLLFRELRNPHLIDVALRLMIHTKPYVFYLHPALVVPQFVLRLARQPGLGFDALVAIKKHRSLQIVLYK